MTQLKSTIKTMLLSLTSGTYTHRKTCLDIHRLMKACEESPERANSVFWATIEALSGEESMQCLIYCYALVNMTDDILKRNENTAMRALIEEKSDLQTT